MYEITVLDNNLVVVYDCIEVSPYNLRVILNLQRNLQCLMKAEWITTKLKVS